MPLGGGRKDRYNRRVMLGVSCSRFLSLAIGLVVILALGPPALASGVTVADIERLLSGGVGESVVLRHVERWGLEHDLDVTDLLRLVEAGASEGLLEGLLDGVSSSSGQITRVEMLPGEGSLLLTNLDEQGRRIGGEVSNSVPFNQVSPPVTMYGPVEELSAGSVARATAVPLEASPPAGISLVRPYPSSFLTPPRTLHNPGGYTRYKLYYSRAPYDGFRTWVPPVTLLVGAPVIVSSHPRTPYGPVLFSY